jgi:membrane-bound lytic murein transglycosylase C
MTRFALIRPAVLVAALAGCQTLDQALNTADRALAVAYSPTARTLTNIANSKDKEEAVRAGLRSRGDAYKQDPRALISDVRTIQRDYQNLMTFLGGKVGKTWGAAEVKLPTRTHFIKYTQNYKSRAIVDFDAGAITVETVDDKDAKTSLKNAVVTTLLTPNDPRAVDLFSDSAVTLTSEKAPYLYGLVSDQNGKPIGVPAEAESFADYLIAGKSGTREVDVADGRKTALFVQFAMVPNFENKQADKYREVVARVAQKYEVSPTLIYAIIRTESNFNPFAVSSAPAYGMMQLVPSSGGREAYRRVTGKDEAPTRDYLLNAENNIELGAAYLGELTHSQLEPIGNLTSREFCVISAYNTGPGNVLRTFSSDRVVAVNAINSLQPPAVYERLRTGLPYGETREYLVKVVNYRRQFVSRAD